MWLYYCFHYCLHFILPRWHVKKNWLISKKIKKIINLNTFLLYWCTKFYFYFNKNKSFTRGHVFQSEMSNSNLFHLSLDADKKVFAVEYLLLSKQNYNLCHDVTSEEQCNKARRCDHLSHTNTCITVSLLELNMCFH